MHHSLVLPLLSEDELQQIFQDDQAAIRRYQILSAVIHGHASAEEAAAQTGSSPRTVRYLLQRYRQNPSIDVLRTQTPGPRGYRRGNQQVNQVVAEVIAAAPQLSARVLLDQVNKRLERMNTQLSRATFYRMLASLRQEHEAYAQQDKGFPLRTALNAALPLLSEEPPIALGNSLLARLFTPPLPQGSALERGQILARIIMSQIASLHPGPDVGITDPRMRLYAILAGEFMSGEDVLDLQARLAISPRTYYRAKRQALDRLVDLLPTALEELTPPSLQPIDPIPESEPFFGREDEISYYQWRLRRDNLAVIWGLAGIGKTALAAKIAAEGQRLGQAVIWHTMGEDQRTVVRDALSALASGLLAVGGPGIAEAVRHWQQESIRLQQAQQMVRLIDLLARRHCVVVLDNARRTDTDPAWDHMLAELRRQAQAGQLRLIVLSRALPDWAKGGGWPALEGLDERAAYRLLESSDMRLDEATWKGIYERTQGHPQLLRLVEAWSHAPRAQHVPLASLLDHSDIHAYLVAEMYGTLSPEANKLLRWCCVLRRPLDLNSPIGQAAINEAGRRRLGLQAVEQLVARALLVQPVKHVYYPPPLVREQLVRFYRNDILAWRRLHKRIAKVYLRMGDYAEAAYHNAQAQ